jgi:hypothetical protein
MRSRPTPRKPPPGDARIRSSDACPPLDASAREAAAAALLLHGPSNQLQCNSIREPAPNMRGRDRAAREQCERSAMPLRADGRGDKRLARLMPLTCAGQTEGAGAGQNNEAPAKGSCRGPRGQLTNPAPANVPSRSRPTPVEPRYGSGQLLPSFRSPSRLSSARLPNGSGRGSIRVSQLPVSTIASEKHSHGGRS